MRTTMLIAGVLLLWSLGQSVQAQEYVAKEIGTLGGPYSQALAISPSGEVVGGSLIADGRTIHAFLYSGRTLKDLGTIGGDQAFATAINASGLIVGYSRPASAGPLHAFTYSDGKMKDLGTLGGPFSYACGVNAAGMIVGTSSTSGELPHYPFVILDGEMKKLDIPATTPNSAAFSINDAGDIVGSVGHAFLYSRGTTKDIGTLGGDSSVAYAINRSGDIVGASQTNNERPPKAASHAFLYSNGAMKDLGTLAGSQSAARAINSAGVVVGDSSATTEPYHHAFIYKAGVMRDLNDITESIPHNLLLRDATGINDAGEIIVNTVDSNAGALGPALLLEPKKAQR